MRRPGCIFLFNFLKGRNYLELFYHGLLFLTYTKSRYITANEPWTKMCNNVLVIAGTYGVCGAELYDLDLLFYI